jgi:hypothetical protein
MSQHALDSLQERAPGLDPRVALSEILTALSQGKAYGVAQNLTGGLVYEVRLSTGQVIFPIVSDGNEIKTVLIEGMYLDTPTGRQILERRGLPVGVHQLDADEYHADPAARPSLNATVGRLLVNASPLHAWTASPRLNPNWQPKVSSTFDVGKAAHQAILGRGEPAVAYPENLLGANGAVSTKAAKDWAESMREAGKVPLKADVVDAIGAMTDRMAAKLAEVDVTLDPANSEVTAIAELDGVLCRCMVDNAPADKAKPLWDVKTTTDASPTAIMRSIMTYGYDFQAAHYLETWKAATGEERNFRFIFQEKEPPYEVCIVELGFDSLALARKKTARAREIWRNCITSDYWPGYPAGVHQIELPAWFHERWLEQESAAEDYRKRTGHDVLDTARRWQAPEGWQGAAE